MNFHRIVIIGVGLLGGSIGLALKDRSFYGRIIGVGRDSSKLKKAKELGIIDEYSIDILNAIKNADLMIICTPVRSISLIYKNIYSLLDGNILVTDVGSSKKELLAEISMIEEKDRHFVGSHPMTGSEKSGINAASSGLFDNSVVAVMDDYNTIDNIKKINRFWEFLGAKIINISSKEHDEIVSETSHLPHIISFLTAYSCMISNNSKNQFNRLFGNGLLDMTRLTMSDPEMWIDIIASNRTNILKNIKEYKNNFSFFEELIINEDYKKLIDLLLKIKDYREKISDSKLKNK